VTDFAQSDWLRRLTNILFRGDPKAICKICHGLDADQRKALYRPLGPLLELMSRDLFRYSYQFCLTTYESIYQAIADASPKEIPKIVKQLAEGRSPEPRQQRFDEVFNATARLLLCIGPKTKVVRAGKLDDSVWWVDGWDAIEAVIDCALVRPEPWIADALRTLLDNANLQISQSLDFMLLAQETRWAEVVAPYLGRAMLSDGYSDIPTTGKRGRKEDHDMGKKTWCWTTHPKHVELILAGLAYDGPWPRPEASEMRPMMHTYWGDEGHIPTVVVKGIESGMLPRDRLWDIALTKMSGPLGKNDGANWVRVVKALAPTDDEINRDRDRVLALVNAPHSTVALYGLQLLPRLDVSNDLVSGELVAALAHDTQGVTVAAFKQIKALHAGGKLDQRTLGEACLAALASPHRKLRELTAKWLTGRKAPQLDPADLLQLQEIAAALESRESAVLAVLFTGLGSNGQAGDEVAGEEMPEPCGKGATLTEDRLAAARASSEPHLVLWSKALAGDDIDLSFERIVWDVDLAQQEAVSLPQSVEETARALIDASHARRPYQDEESALALERAYAGISRFAPQGHEAERILSPLLGLWQKINDAGKDEFEEVYRKPGREALLAKAWVSGGAVTSYKSFTGEWFTDGCDASFLAFLARLGNRPEARFTLLATPTHMPGWIDPAVFFERLRSCDGKDIWSPDLAAALFRLPAQGTEERWAEVAPVAKNASSRVAAALTIAFDDSTVIDVLTKPVKKYDQWGNLDEVEPGDPLKTAAAWLRHRRSQSLAAEDLGAFDAIAGHALISAIDWAWTAERYVGKVPAAYVLRDVPSAASWALLERVVSLPEESRWSKTTIDGINMLQLGHPRWSLPGPGLPHILTVLRSRFAEHREPQIDLLLAWLSTGRITPAELIDELARTIVSTTGKGFSHLDSSLESMSAGGTAAALVALAAVERAIEEIQDLPVRSRSVLCDRYYALLVDTGRQASATTRQTLESMIQRSKSSAAAKRAKQALAGAGRQRPLARELLEALVAESFNAGSC
jgi:hypothetical protein